MLCFSLPTASGIVLRQNLRKTLQCRSQQRAAFGDDAPQRSRKKNPQVTHVAKVLEQVVEDVEVGRDPLGVNPFEEIFRNNGSAALPPQSLVSSREQYDRIYKNSIEDPAGFWGSLAKQFHWETQFDDDHHTSNFDTRKGRIQSEWFKGGRTNIAYNCLDRHVDAGAGAQTCFLWEGNDVGMDDQMTYKEVLDEVCRLANWLKSVGVGKGDSVAIYMPMVCELPIAMLACARIGAVHSVVFGGYSADCLAERVMDCKAKVVITATGVRRGKKKIGLKAIVDDALASCKMNGFEVETCLVMEKCEAHPDAPCEPHWSGSCTPIEEPYPWTAGRDVKWHEQIPQQSTKCDVEWVDSEHPLFLLYTSGATGRPKGVVHTTGGYMVAAAISSQFVFDLHPADVFWCTADCGWITGHTYLTYGPLLNCATSLIFEGIPSYPTPARCWEIVEKYKVKQFYTAPTVIRSLMRHSDSYVTGSDRSSLRLLGSVGEPINPEAWDWYHKVVGEGRCPVVDTWWQTETGSHAITPLPGAWAQKPGSASLPFFGVLPVILDPRGNVVEGAGEGLLCIKQAWPSAIRTIYGDHGRYERTYFEHFKGYYFTGDLCRRDADGYYWITGREDDVINVSGHRIGPAEVEAALDHHPQVAEAAVVGYHHPIKGQGIYAYVSVKDEAVQSPELKEELIAAVRKAIGRFAAPEKIHWARHLPKTRSGKIMRRVLRKIAASEEESLGDLSTMADPGIVEVLVATRVVEALIASERGD